MRPVDREDSRDRGPGGDEIRRTAEIIRAALDEDMGSGDITTGATVARRTRGVCRIVARQDLVLAGSFVAEIVFGFLDRRVRFTRLAEEGRRLRRGRPVAELSGPLGPMLTGERVALNFLQHLSGIATLTARYVRLAAPARVLDTRKTTPCLRALERYAVRTGGGLNHRFDLGEALLIKDNHIRAAGSVAEAVRRASRRYGEDRAIEVEVGTLRETREALAAGADIIMLDNMRPALVRRAVEIIAGRAVTEASGGITLENIGEYGATGVDFISVGAITHSAPAADLSMEVVSIDGHA